MTKGKWTVIVVFGGAAAALLALIVWAGFQSNLWDELRAMGRIPWGLVTLADLTAGLVVAAVWVVVLERRWWSAAIWILLMAGFGNLVTLLYFINRLRRFETVHEALTGHVKVPQGQSRRRTGA